MPPIELIINENYQFFDNIDNKKNYNYIKNFK